MWCVFCRRLSLPLSVSTNGFVRSLENKSAILVEVSRSLSVKLDPLILSLDKWISMDCIQVSVKSPLLSRYIYVYTCTKFSLVVTCQPPESPLYLRSLMPTPADSIDTVATEKTATDMSPSPADPSHTGSESTANKTEEEKEFNDSQELYENPFLKPPKRIRLKLLN